MTIKWSEEDNKWVIKTIDPARVIYLSNEDLCLLLQDALIRVGMT